MNSNNLLTLKEIAEILKLKVRSINYLKKKFQIKPRDYQGLKKQFYSLEDFKKILKEHYPYHYQKIFQNEGENN